MNQTKYDKKARGRRTRILIVDDHPIVCDGLSFLIDQEADMIVCATAGNGAEAVRAVKEHRIDLAAVDMLLKKTTGIVVTKKIKSLCPDLKVLMFSMSDDPWLVKQAFAAGAKGYITKDELSEKVIDAIRHVRNGGVYLSQRLLRQFSKRRRNELFAQDGTSTPDD